jgi:hypothetical protein
MKFKIIFAFIVLILFSACKGGGGGAFEALEDETNQANADFDGPIDITSVSPSSDPVIVTSGLETFAVQIADGAGANVKYNFRLDGISMQDTSSSFYVLTGSSLSTGDHTLVVEAYNSKYSDTYTYNLYRNAAPTLTLVSSNSTTLSCGIDTFTLSLSASDVNVPDRSSLVFSSYLDSTTPSAFLSNTFSVNSSSATASVTFAPDCTLIGTHTVEIRVEDQWGDEASYPISVTVTNDGVITIDSYSPTSNPVLITNNASTFAVSLAAGAGSNVTYLFSLDGSTVQNSSSPFYSLNGTALAAGSHTLEVTASNPAAYSDSQTWNLFKNTSPTISLVSNSATTIDCGVDTFSISVSATDADVGDRASLAFSSYLNGASSATFLTDTFSVTAGSATATVDFTPNCSLLGTNTIKIRITDQWGGYSEYPITVTVENPTTVAIGSYSPTTTTVLHESGGSSSQLFFVTATGNNPLSYSWSLPTGPSVTSCTSSSCTITGGAGYTGEKTLTASVNDAAFTGPVTQAFTIRFNDKPEVTTASPSENSSTSINCQSSQIINVTFSDSYLQTPASTFSLTWKVNGSSVSTTILNPSAVTGTGPYTASATFSPNCNSSYLGDNTISLDVSDGYETDSASWTVNTSFFSTECLNMTSTPGVAKICTLAGIPGLADDVEVGSTLVAGGTNNDAYKVRVRPNFIEEYESGTNRGFFISDTYHHVVWFYNHNTSGDITVLGKTIGPKKIKALIGAGAPGYGVDNLTYNNFYLHTPHGVAWDSSNSTLYISDAGNNRIVKITGSGVGTGYTTAAGTSNTNGHVANSGAAGTSQRCQHPAGLEISNSKLYVACFSNTTVGDGAIKSFNLSTNAGTNVVMYNTTNTAGGVGVATAHRAWALAKHPSSELVFFSTFSTCAVGVVNNSGSNFNNANNFTTTIATANVGYITSSAACASPTAGTQIGIAYSNANFRMQDYVNLHVKMDATTGTTLQGLFLTQDEANYVAFLNLSGSSVTSGNQAVAAGVYDRVWGNGTAGAVYSQPGVSASQFNVVRGLGILTNSSGGNTTLMLGDIYGYKVASLDLVSANGVVSSVLGTQAPYGYDGEIDNSATKIRLNRPTALAFDETNNRLYFADSLNYRIRYVDLSNGRIRTAVGGNTNTLNQNNGAGNANASNSSNSTAQMRLVRSLAIAEDINSILFTDTAHDSGGTETGWGRLTPNSNGGYLNFLAYQGVGATRMCHLRMANLDSSDHTVNNVLVSAGQVFALAGLTASGCSAWNAQTQAQWDSTTEGETIFGQALGSDPFGLIVAPQTSGGVDYVSKISLRGNHCIGKINSSGVFSTEIGLCNDATDVAGVNSGNTDGAFATARLTSPGMISPDRDPSNYDYGNYFIVDNAMATTSGRIKYVNFKTGGGSSVDVLGDSSSVIPSLEVGTLVNSSFTSIPFAYAVIANDRMVCVNQGAYSPATTSTTVYAHNIICIDRVGNYDLQVGRTAGSASSTYIRSGIQIGSVDEGVTAGVTTKISHPMGMAFDSEGNLYFADYGSHTIKMIKKWW